MDGRRVTTSTSMSGSIDRNMRHIAHLRRKIRNLEQEVAEIKQRLQMLLEDLNGNIMGNDELRLIQQAVEEQLQLQDALNGELEEEINELRRIVEREPQRGVTNIAPTQEGNAPDANPAP